MVSLERPWFHLGVVGPDGFDRPDLARRLWRRMLPLLRERLYRRERISTTGVFGTPLSVALGEIAKSRDWGHGGFPVSVDRPRRVGHRAACAQVAVAVDALLVVHAGELPADLLDLLDWCRWLGVATRTVAIPTDPE